MHRILVVDDEPSYLEPLKLLLERAGYETEVADSADTAVRRGTEFRPSVVVVDWGLGGQADGLSVAEALQKGNPQLGVIVITGYPTAELQARLAQFPGAQCLAKPFRTSELVDAVQAVLSAIQGDATA